MRPSETLDQYWIFSANGAVFNSKTTEHTFPYAGKWLLFVSPNKIDTVWEKVDKATQKGLLGISSKCSTRIGALVSLKKDMVICVYTYDYRNKQDLFRVRKELRKMGFNERIPYKTNQTTREGKYAVNGQHTSLYYE